MLNRSALLAYSGIPPSWGISRFPDPSVALPSAVQDIAWAPDESAVALLTGNTNINAYRWSASGFGDRIFAPFNPGSDSLPGRIFFSNNGSFLGIRRSFQISIFQWSSATGLGSRFNYPFATMGVVYPTVFSKTDGHIFTSVTTENSGLIALPFSGTTFGTPLVPPTPSSVMDGRTEIAIHPSGSPVVITGFNGVQAFEWTGSAWGARSTVETPAAVGTSVAFHPDGNALALGGDFTPFGRAYSWSSGGRGAALRGPGSAFGSITGNMQFSKRAGAVDKLLLHSTGGGTGNKLRVLGWNANGTTEHYRNPAELPSRVSSRKSAFSPSGNYLAVPLSSSPFIHIYTVNPS